MLNNTSCGCYTLIPETQSQQITKILEECQEYHERLQVVAEQAISFDLNDGVVVNYAKFADVVQKLK